eukprot:TRINITY_DN23969_c0_g1_i1.p2 TRINITY_DN23969_c0_g1~~TRINITY_DN23969_c0_g1_i1.p2  ORF type:complete len:116 (-),score=30.16 TRINITY_DN23969_c0_g1_i1:1-348(-)
MCIRDRFKLAHETGFKPQLALEYNNMGRFCFEQGLFKEALRHFAKARSIGFGTKKLREYVDAVLGMGYVMKAQGRPEASCRVFRDAVMKTRHLQLENVDLEHAYLNANCEQHTEL